MNTACYAGTHMSVWVPVGIVCAVVFCLVPPATSFTIALLHRDRLTDPAVERRFGFLYKRYRPDRYWWEGVLQLQELTLVAVEVFARALETSQQALLMLVAFIAIGVMNAAFAPLRTHLMGLLEFISLGVLSLTVTLSLYFVVSADLKVAAADAIGAIIVAINVGLFVGFVVLIIRKSVPKLKKKLMRLIPKLQRGGDDGGSPAGGGAAPAADAGVGTSAGAGAGNCMQATPRDAGCLGLRHRKRARQDNADAGLGSGATAPPAASSHVVVDALSGSIPVVLPQEVDPPQDVIIAVVQESDRGNGTGPMK